MLGRGGHNGAGGVLMASGLGLDTLCDTPPPPRYLPCWPLRAGRGGFTAFFATGSSYVVDSHMDRNFQPLSMLVRLLPVPQNGSVPVGDPSTWI